LAQAEAERAVGVDKEEHVDVVVKEEQCHEDVDVVVEEEQYHEDEDEDEAVKAQRRRIREPQGQRQMRTNW
jgi:hypothetical protein